MSTKLSYASFTLNDLISLFCMSERKINNSDKANIIVSGSLSYPRRQVGGRRKKDEDCKYVNNNHLIELITKESVHCLRSQRGLLL